MKDTNTTNHSSRRIKSTIEVKTLSELKRDYNLKIKKKRIGKLIG